MSYNSTLKLYKPQSNNIQSLYFHHYDVINGEYSFFKETDKKGKILSDTTSGNIKLTLSVLPDDALMGWVFDEQKLFNGEVTINDAHSETLDKFYFEQGRCVDFRLNYTPADDNGKNIRLSIIINAQRIIIGEVEFENTWK